MTTDTPATATPMTTTFPTSATSATSTPSPTSTTSPTTMPGYRVKAITEDDFWQTIDDAWAAAGDKGAHYTIAKADGDERDKAFEVVYLRMPAMRETLIERLTKYTEAELLAWDKHFLDVLARLSRSDFFVPDINYPPSTVIGFGLDFVEKYWNGYASLGRNFECEMLYVTWEAAKRRWGTVDILYPDDVDGRKARWMKST